MPEDETLPGKSGAEGAVPSWGRLWARDSALMALSQGLTVVATSVAAILIARNLEADDWGVFSALFGLSFAIAILVEFGLSTWLLRELSRLFAREDDADEERARPLVEASVGGAIGVSLIVVLSIPAVSVALGQPAGIVAALTSLIAYGGMFATGNVLESYLRARRRLGRVVFASIVEKYVLLMLLVAIAVTSSAVWLIGLAYVFAGLIRLSVLGVGVFGWSLPRVPSLREVWEVWCKSLPFALSAGAINVVPRLDTLLLLVLSAVAAGYFAIGERILGPAVALAVIGATTLYPFLARRTHSPRAIWSISAAFGLFGGVLAVIGYLTAPTLVPAVFGEQYEPGVTAVQVMLLVLPLLYASNPLLTYGFSYGKERAIVVATVASAVVGSAAIVVGQLIWGATGAASGLLFRQALLLVVFALIAAAAGRADVDRGSLPVTHTAQAIG